MTALQILVLLCLTAFTLDYWWGYVLLILSVLLLVLFVQISINRVISSRLMKACDPEACAEYYREMIGIKKRSIMASGEVLGLVNADILSGNLDEAEEYLRKLSNVVSKLSPYEAMLLDFEKLSYEMTRGDLAEGQEQYEWAKWWYSVKRLSLMQKQYLKQIGLVMKVYEARFSGDREQLRKVLSNLPDNEMFIRIQKSYLLGCIEEEDDNLQKAREFFKDVAENGGTTRIAKMSREKTGLPSEAE